MDDQSSLERFSVPESIPHDEGVAWRRKQFLESGKAYDPNAKHLMSMNEEWRKGKRV